MLLGTLRTGNVTNFADAVYLSIPTHLVMLETKFFTKGDGEAGGMNSTRKTVSPDRNSSSVFEQMCIKHNVIEERRKETGSKWEGAVEGRELMAQSQVCAPPRPQCAGAKQCVQPTGDEGAIPVPSQWLLPAGARTMDVTEHHLMQEQGTHLPCFSKFLFNFYPRSSSKTN